MMLRASSQGYKITRMYLPVDCSQTSRFELYSVQSIIKSVAGKGRGGGRGGKIPSQGQKGVQGVAEVGIKIYRLV